MAEYGQKNEKAQAKVGRKVKKSAKRAIRKTHPATLLAAFLCLLIGIAAGGFYTLHISKGDCFRLHGESAYTVAQGVPFTYREEGAEAISFGRDVSEKIQVETTLQKDAAGNYVIPTDKAGVYTITYTVDCLKYGAKNPNGAIRRIRVFTVSNGGEG